MSYDPRCHDLAELFLSDEPALKGREAELAQIIQTAIEDWIEYERRPDIMRKEAEINEARLRASE